MQIEKLTISQLEQYLNKATWILNISLYVEKIIEDDLPSVEEVFADLKVA